MPRISRTRRARRCSACECQDRKSTRLNSSHSQISYAVFCLKKKKSRPLVLDQPLDHPLTATATHNPTLSTKPQSLTRHQRISTVLSFFVLWPDQGRTR